MRQRLRQALPQQPMTPVVLADGEPVAVVYASVNGIEIDLLRQHLQARGAAPRNVWGHWGARPYTLPRCMG